MRASVSKDRRSALWWWQDFAGLLALHGRAQHAATGGRVEIAEGEVHGCAVVPTDQIADPPLMAVDVFRLYRLLAEILDYGCAFGTAHAVETRRALH